MSQRLWKLTAKRGSSLWMSLVLLVGCAQQQSVTTLPSPPWPESPPTATHDRPSAKPAPTAPTVLSEIVLPRARWSNGAPKPSKMNRMTGIRSITVHHDGMDPFHRTEERAVAARIEIIRKRHRGKGWGDIGYHYVVDPAGRVWEARPLIYQGAHVKDHNVSNIGVVALGNFDEQTPSGLQREALRRLVNRLMRTYNIPPERVLTHQEWRGAVTACPGTRLQQYVEVVRRNGGMG